ncbi:unnamed protein product, partial [Ixodes persulcatus]
PRSTRNLTGAVDRTIVDVVGNIDNIVCQGDDEASAGAECGGPSTTTTDSGKRTSPAAIDASDLRVWRHPTPAAATAGSHGTDSACGGRRRGLASSAASTTSGSSAAPPGTWSLSLSSPADTRALTTWRSVTCVGGGALVTEATRGRIGKRFR